MSRRAAADPSTCRTAILKAGARHARSVNDALLRCRSGVVRGALPPSTDCSTDPATLALLASADAKLRGAIERGCGGADRACGTPGDDALAAVGWNLPSCPDLESAGCRNDLADCGDVADCLACVDRAAGARAVGTATERIELSSPSGSELERCQSKLGKSMTKLIDAESLALRKCWTSVAAGTASGPCPAPGDGHAAAAIDAARAVFAKSVCRACGGADHACEGPVGGVPGTGQADDMTPAAIGFAGTCPDVTPPGAAQSCAAPVRTLPDLATCLECVGGFAATCTIATAIPALSPDAASCSTLVLAESFAGPDGSAWPAPWTPIGGVDLADLSAGRGRWRPQVSFYSLARLAAPAGERDVDVKLDFTLGDSTTQGLGFYVRQNGGYLQTLPTFGQGYAVFFERFRPDGAEDPSIGLWIEENGVESPLSITHGVLPVVAGVAHRIRFRASQAGPGATQLRARIWPSASPEPSTWQVEVLDTNPVLQGVAGGLAIDAWSDINPGTPGSPTPSFLYVDDVEVRRLRDPLAGIGALVPVQGGFQFAEGPRWRPDGTLLFTDIDASVIYRLTPPATISVFREPSDNANGLATDVNGDLLAAEHGARRVSRTASGGSVSAVFSAYQGQALNSPNDVAVRSDGTLYVTDPRYGNPPTPELPFNALFRLTPAGTATVEWQGGPTSGPNGVELSPDERTLYMTETAVGSVFAWDVAPDGSLANQRVFAAGLTTPDGTCVDVAGNLWVATWGDSLEVFAPDGTRWGSVAMPEEATNCAFGGSDRRTLYATTRHGLYRMAVEIPGVP